MAHDVFISYSSKDKPIADAICANLEATGVRCWIAPRDIAPGEDWPAAISKAISQSRVMVLVFSAHSNSSEDVGRELILAANSKLVIIPFKIENVEPEPGKQYYLARTHWLDAINPPTREQIHLLVKTVGTFLPVVPDEARTGEAITGKGMAGASLPKPAPGKKVGWLLYLLIPALLLLLGAGAWMTLSFLTRLVAPAPVTGTLPAAVIPLSTPTIEIPTLTPAPKDWNVRISDTFSSNLNGWPLLNNSDDGCSVSNLVIQSDTLLWTLDAPGNNNCGYVYNPRIPSVSDFDASVDVKRSSGTGEAFFGIGFRIIDGNNHYFFVINDTARYFTVRRILNDSWSTLIDWTPAPEINTDGTNHLAVIARGGSFSFYINEKLVGSVEDTGIASGRVGIVAEISNGGNISISYDNFVLQGSK